MESLIGRGRLCVIQFIAPNQKLTGFWGRRRWYLGRKQGSIRIHTGWSGWIRASRVTWFTWTPQLNTSFSLRVGMHLWHFPPTRLCVWLPHLSTSCSHLCEPRALVSLSANDVNGICFGKALNIKITNDIGLLSSTILYARMETRYAPYTTSVLPGRKGGPPVAQYMEEGSPLCNRTKNQKSKLLKNFKLLLNVSHILYTQTSARIWADSHSICL